LRDGLGVDTIAGWLEKTLQKSCAQEEDSIILNSRQQYIVEQIVQRIEKCLEQGSDAEEILAQYLGQINELLDEFVGRIDTQELFDTIFTTFCIGK
jgi:tRNA modification GTPase